MKPESSLLVPQGYLTQDLPSSTALLPNCNPTSQGILTLLKETCLLLMQSLCIVGNLCSRLPPPIPGPAPQKACQGSAPSQELLKTTLTGYVRPGRLT